MPTQTRTTIGVPRTLLNDFKKATKNNASQEVIDFMQRKVNEMRRKKAYERGRELMRGHKKMTMREIIKSYKDDRK